MGLIGSILVNALAFFVGGKILDGVKLGGIVQAIIVAVVIALLSVTLGTLLKIVSLGLLALGIFTLLLDAILIQVADYFLDGFEVRNFWWALALAAVVAVINSVLSYAS